ncbi:MAG TPA: RDD family protein [Thermosynechococcaceae cyanobacterium]
MKYVGLGKRFVALLIDGIILQFVNYLIAAVTGGTTEGGYSVQGPAALLVFAVNIGYGVVLEKIQGATLGKQVVGIKVVRMDGSPIDWSEAVIRNLLRIVDFLPFLYIVGVVLISNSPLRQRFGDRIAKTVVVEKNSV